MLGRQFGYNIHKVNKQTLIVLCIVDHLKHVNLFTKLE